MKALIFAGCLVVGLAGCSSNGNAGRTADTSINGNTDTTQNGTKANSGGSGMTGPTTGTMQSGDTAMQQRMNNTHHKDSMR